MQIVRSSFIVLAVLLVAAPALAKRDRFVDKDEYKKRERALNCAITDYGDMMEGDGIDWVWVSPSARVGTPGPIEIKPIKKWHVKVKAANEMSREDDEYDFWRKGPKHDVAPPKTTTPA